MVSAATAAHAQGNIPDLKGTWTGKGKSIVFGNNPHHPGSQTAAHPPRVRDIEVTYVVDGQEGQLAWGRASSTTAESEWLDRRLVPRDGPGEEVGHPETLDTTGAARYRRW